MRNFSGLVVGHHMSSARHDSEFGLATSINYELVDSLYVFYGNEGVQLTMNEQNGATYSRRTVSQTLARGP